MKLFVFIAIALTLAAVANDAPQSLPPKDFSHDIESLRRDVDLLLENNSKIEARLSNLEKPPTPPAKQPEQTKPPSLVPSKVASDTLPSPKPVAKYTVDTRPGHWTYPNQAIDDLTGNRNELRHHLRTTHGSIVDGMTNEQLLNMHDVLHEEPNQPVVRVQQAQPSMLYRPSTCPPGQACPQRIQQVQTRYVQPQRVFRRW